MRCARGSQHHGSEGSAARIVTIQLLFGLILVQTVAVQHHGGGGGDEADYTFRAGHDVGCCFWRAVTD